MEKRKSSKIKPVRTSAQSGRYTAYIATSIDGRIAQSGRSGTDWTSKEDWNFFQKSLRTADVVIVGRNTYKVAEARLIKRNTIVLTSKVNTIKHVGSVIFLNPAKTDLKRFLEGQKYKNVAILGGAKVYTFCLENKMLDELFVTIEPYVFNAGIPMFFGTTFSKYKFRLVSIKKLNTKGTILVKYQNENSSN